MRSLLMLAVLAPLTFGLAACGDDDKTVVINPQPNATVVVPPGGATKVCPAGTVC
ncbi:hypothetical protein [Desertibaculum subflavum]|uniref:hypothetical protein n=1 Tax=Desertibaculum subflavum TaxID=2268458 RepID=UPI0013C51875